MIKYISLEVQNYKSIGYAMVHFIPGTYAVIGTTDGGYSSNGSGKSTILQALYLALYNKDFQGAPVDSLSNRFTGEDFKLTLEMYVDRDGAKADYRIVNDRKAKRYKVYKDGSVHVEGIAKCLKFIQDLVGMSDSTFKFTHYITTNSILDLTNNLTNATLFNEVLQVTQLKVMAQDLAELKKGYQDSIDTLKEEFHKLLTVHKLLHLTKEHDEADLQLRLESIDQELHEVTQLSEQHILPLKESLARTRDIFAEKRTELKQKQESHSAGICSLCGTVLALEVGFEGIERDIVQLKIDTAELTSTLQLQTEQLQELEDSRDITINSLRSERTDIVRELGVIEQVHKVKEGVLDGVIYSEARFTEAQEQLKHLNKLTDHIDGAREAIRSGKIFEEIMDDFFRLVNNNIQRYKQVINFNSFEVEVTSYRSGMLVILRNGGHEIPIESLSNGEKARLSLLILSALLESMQQTTQSDSNFIVFDEATSSFDKSGIKELQALFSHLKQLGQACFIITHGSELAEVAFDGQLVVEKVSNVATVTMRIDDA